jgi:hypothetical protein
VKVCIALTSLALALLEACSSTSLAPKGWQPIPGATDAWSSGSGANAQEYRYSKSPFGGSLQDLASSVTIDALTRYRGAKFQRSTPFPPCPGAAGVAAFRLANGRMLQEAFAVRDGQAIRIRYSRPAEAALDPAAVQAMQTALCTL